MGELDPVCIYERLLEDDDLKDVTIEFSDGTLRAHGCVLSAASEAVKGILRNGCAQESRSLVWKEYDLKVGRFFLRLLYTGCVEERDWVEPTQVSTTATSAGSERSIASATGVSLTRTDLTRSEMAMVLAQITPQDGSRVRVLRDTNALVMGTSRFIPAGTVGTVNGGGKSVVWSSNLGPVTLDSLRGNFEAVEPRPPLSLLTGAIAIAKVYQFASMLGALTACIRKRLSVQTFDEICQAAIRDDMQILRYHCMRFADSESREARELRELYNEGQLSPEVTHELDGLWRQDTGRVLKRRRGL